MSEFVQATLYAEVREPVLAVLEMVSIDVAPARVLSRRCRRKTLQMCSISEPVFWMLPSQKEETHSSSSGHGSQQTAVDLNHFFDCLTSYPISGRRSRIGSNDDTAFESKRKSCGSMCKLYGAVWVGIIICCGSEKCRRLREKMISAQSVIDQGFVMDDLREQQEVKRT